MDAPLHANRIEFSFLFNDCRYSQGCVFTGLWVIAHECGHRAFAQQNWINYLVGHILHTSLLVPFHPWRISHANHHAKTNCMEDDEVFVPSQYDSKKELTSLSTSHRLNEAFATTPIGAWFDVMKVALVGWPAYIIINASGPEKYQNKRNSHFDAQSALFTKGERKFVRESLVWFAAVVVGLVLLSLYVGADMMAAHYFIPYLVVNAHLTLITYLQHTDTYVPHWHQSEFTFLRGALATVDRKWGFIRDILFHHIADSHVVHHMFSDMPFYYAMEATRILEGWEEFQQYRLKDYTPIWLALYRSSLRCRIVPSGGDVCWYENGRESELNAEVVKASVGKQAEPVESKQDK